MRTSPSPCPTNLLLGIAALLAGMAGGYRAELRAARRSG
jgi:hypothetical protein